jgi:uncharacterized protein DUF6438
MTRLRTELAAVFAGVAVLASAGCSPDTNPPTVPPQSERLPEVTAAPAGVPNGFSFLYDLGIRIRPNAAAEAALPFATIMLERTGCMGTCPVYQVTLNVDGTAAFDGIAHVGRIGKFVGRVPLYDFAQLAILAERRLHDPAGALRQLLD